MKKSLLAYILQAIIACGAITSPTVFANNTGNSPASTAVTQQRLGFELIKQSINKSPNDQAIYQGIKLANGMEVLLISDEKANKSLMSVGLPVGSMEDPMSQQGLAHYLEHMILMGSKNFPETNSLDTFLTQNGGYNNAYTGSGETVYYLEVNNDAFNEAVERLADALAEPLLSETNAKKEINAVNAEMVRAKSNDGFLLQDVQIATANPKHPMTKFSVGNNVTLSDKPESKLHDALWQFYQQYYSANLMKAVLYSNQPIEKLAKLAESHLGKIKNKAISAPTVSEPLYRAEDKSVMIEYKPIQPNKALMLIFDLPEDKAQFKHKSGAYLSYLFSNNTAGTLSDYLIKQGFSDSGIQAETTADVSRNRGEFTIYVNLTEKGLKAQDQIISLIFQQIEKIKQAGIQASYFNEVKKSLNQSFQHLQIEKGGNYISGLVSQMLHYPLENIIDRAYIIEDMDEKAIRAKLAEMTIDNVRIIAIRENAHTDKKTRYFETPYSVNKITEAQKEKWLNFSQNPEIKLPELNQYFATDFSINTQDHSRQMPTLIEKSQGTAIYAMPSHYFPNEPKALLNIQFMISPEKYDIKQGISASLLAYMNELSQTQLMFQASVAGMASSGSSSNNHLSLSVGGYTQHLAKFIKDIVLNFRQFELNEAVLTQAKQRYLEALDQQEKANALKQAGQVISSFANYPYFEPAHQRKVLEQIQLADIQQMRETLLTKQTGLTALSVGNFTDQQVQQITDELKTIIKMDNNALDYGKYLDIHQSQRKVNYIKSIPHQDNALIVAYYPNHYNEIEGLARATLLKEILYSWYFDDLRTDKQLGYAVHTSTSHIGKTYGLLFAVQSPNASTQEIMTHNQRFFAESLKKLKAMTADEFEKYRASLIKVLQHKPESLNEEFEQFTFDFHRGNARFDRKSQIIEQIKGLSQAEIITFYQQAVMEQNGFVFASQAIGTNNTISQPAEFNGFEKVESLEALQKTFELKAF